MIPKRIPLPEAARLLGWRYWRTRDALLVGKLRGGRAPDGRYWIETTSVRKLIADQDHDEEQAG
jgi:hypothetical protein